jgi:hypothetical protein
LRNKLDAIAIFPSSLNGYLSVMKHLFFIGLSFLCLNVKAQDASLALQKKPILNPQIIDDQWGKVPNGLNVSFASSNARFARELPPKLDLEMRWEAKAWKGEKIHTQLLALDK